ncbi:MAG: Sll0314/Alr1548 family TPR repeat-containing protein [Leptolyngbyaceae cyanobacterium bins.59]|nr:Sll0314/Alr1548 family TPR repeat-containing protein [Leptolyngbyaceae cyanobacterium bins.59]
MRVRPQSLLNVLLRPAYTHVPAMGKTVALGLGLLITLGAAPSLAKDPFRTTQPRPIGDKTEAAFRAIFERGNYEEANTYLRQAEAKEPLAHAMRASLAYTSQDWETFRANAIRTRETAEELVKTDPLRGNIYLATGHFLEGAYTLVQEGTVKGAPKALNKLQQVFTYLAAAEKISPQDPELNIIKGFMDLMVAVNLPFSDANEAIERLDKYAGPRYLAYRGIAMGYRDLKQGSKALEFVDKAIQSTPGNPEVLYLKAQILVKDGKLAESLPFFKQAMEKKAQLPTRLAAQLGYESCMAQGESVGLTRNQRHPYCLERYLAAPNR